MKYKAERKRVSRFKNMLKKFCGLESAVRAEASRSYSSDFFSVRESQAHVQNRCLKKFTNEYSDLRDEIAKEIPGISRIAWSLGVNTERLSYPPPMVGGPVIPVDVFHSILEDYGYVPTHEITRFDTLNKMLGILKETKQAALFQAFNPLNWLSNFLKIPFWLIRQTGFNTEKIENALWGKLFRLLELLILIYVFIAWWGFTPVQLAGMLKIT